MGSNIILELQLNVLSSSRQSQPTNVFQMSNCTSRQLTLARRPGQSRSPRRSSRSTGLSIAVIGGIGLPRLITCLCFSTRITTSRSATIAFLDSRQFGPGVYGFLLVRFRCFLWIHFFLVHLSCLWRFPYLFLIANNFRLIDTIRWTSQVHRQHVSSLL